MLNFKHVNCKVQLGASLDFWFAKIIFPSSVGLKKTGLEFVTGLTTYTQQSNHSTFFM